MHAIHILGQILFGGYFIWSGINHFRNHKMLAGYSASMKVPSPTAAVIVSGILLVLGGLGILFNVHLNFSLLLVILFLVPVTLVMHGFWKMTDPTMKMTNMVNFTKNVALIGAALMLMI